MEEFLLELLRIIIMIVVPVATSVLTILAKRYLNEWIDKNAKGKMAEDLKKGVDLIAESVDYVQQTYVNELKEAESFDKEAQKIAMQAAKERAIALMNNDIKMAIESTYSNLDLYATTLIESIIAKKK